MLTYQLQDRGFLLDESESDKPLEFPNQAVIEMKLGPPQAFGASDGTGSFAIRGSKVRIRYNANTGRSQVQFNPPLEPLDVVMKYPNANQQIELKGDVLRYEFLCNDYEGLEGALNALSLSVT